jgi:hypothetical protein
MPDFNMIDGAYGHTPQAEIIGSRLPYYLAAKELETIKKMPLVRKLFGKTKWSPNEGATKLRTEIISKSPVRRQLPNPNKLLTQEPKVDVIGQRRFFTEAEPVWQEFHSSTFRWQNSFVDKIPVTIDRARADMTEKIMTFGEQYAVAQLWGHCPSVYVAGYGWVASPVGTDFSDPACKPTDWVKAQLIANAKEASVVDFMKIASEMHDNRGIPFFAGKDFNETDPTNYGGRFALLCSTEFALQMTFDPYVVAKKALDVDLVGDRWKTAPFSFYNWRTWQMPLRYAQDGTLPEPEISEMSDDAFNKGETIPNPGYTKIDQAPWECAIILGKGAGEMMEVGPPPSAFTGGSPTGALLSMDWNGKLVLNKNFLVDTVDNLGNVKQALNPGARQARFEATLSDGFVPLQRRAIAFYFFKRKLG